MYGRPYGPQGGGGNIQRFLFGGGTPLTISVVALHIVLFFLLFGFSQGWVVDYLPFVTQYFPAHFWTLVTWPLATAASDPLSLIFSLGWFFTFAASMERAWGTERFGLFFAATTVLTAIGLFLGSLFLGPGVVAGLWAATGPVAVAWSVVNRRESVGLFFVSVPAPFVAVLGAVMTWYYAGHGLLGVFALLGCAAAWWYVNQNSRGYATRRTADLGFNIGNRAGRGSDVTPETASRFYQFDRESVGGARRGFNLLRWWRDRQERKRLEEIFRRSGYTDRDEK